MTKAPAREPFLLLMIGGRWPGPPGCRPAGPWLVGAGEARRVYRPDLAKSCCQILRKPGNLATSVATNGDLLVFWQQISRGRPCFYTYRPALAKSCCQILRKPGNLATSVAKNGDLLIFWQQGDRCRPGHALRAASAFLFVLKCGPWPRPLGCQRLPIEIKSEKTP